MADKQPHDGPMLVGLAAFVFLLICIIFWLAMSVEISSGIRWIRVGELKLASIFSNKYQPIIDQLKKLRPEQITPFFLLKMTEATGGFFRIPIALVLAAMSATSFLRKPKHPYTRKLKLEDMVKEQASAFPVTKPITKFNPLQNNFRTLGDAVPEKLPPFAEALVPEEWVAFHSIPLIEGIIDHDAARRAFAKQLGGRWKGVEHLPWHLRALFAGFTMKAGGLRTESDEYFGRVSECWVPGRGLVLTQPLKQEIQKTIRDPKLGRVTEKVAAQHAFVAPALIRCLQMARDQGGVLAPAQFLWLRAVDRTMWYPLNNLGRAAVHSEAAGAIAHYRTEKSAGKPIPNPQVDTAVEGLAQYLLENDITRFPAKEFSRA
jgi:intracellular multiplication protein IcmP